MSTNLFRWRGMAVFAGMSVFAGAGVVSAYAVTTPLSATVTQLAAMSANVAVPMSPEQLWAHADDPDFLCDLFPACAGISRQPGRAEVYDVTIPLTATDLPLVGGAANLTARVEVADREPGDSLSMRVSIDHALGSFDSHAVLSLVTLRGGRTQVRYSTLDATGTGILGREAIAQVAQDAQMRVAGTLRRLASVDATGLQARVRVDARERIGSKRRVQVSIAIPEGAAVGASQAQGEYRVYVGHRIACRGHFVAGAASCLVPARQLATMRTFATVRGSLSTGQRFTAASRPSVVVKTGRS